MSTPFGSFMSIKMYSVTWTKMYTAFLLRMLCNNFYIHNTSAQVNIPAYISTTWFFVNMKTICKWWLTKLSMCGQDMRLQVRPTFSPLTTFSTFLTPNCPKIHKINYYPTRSGTCNFFPQLQIRTSFPWKNNPHKSPISDSRIVGIQPHLIAYTMRINVSKQ